jgi:hypothetical protein
MSGPYFLLEVKDAMRSSNPFTAKFEDIEGRAAFTM